MPTARKDQVNLNLCRYYHCVSRCVRRAFLCGQDSLTGRQFDHRKQWFVSLMHELAHVFAVRICAYAVMSNHYHLVLYVDTEQAQSWSHQEVTYRWSQLFPMSKAQAYLRLNLDFDNLSDVQASSIDLWRQQWMDISWFMRMLNETIARKANKEDECTGRFWEGRFKSQALLDDSALLACMAYVDLNPIRAGINQTPETSDFTSIQQRIQSYQENLELPDSLVPFVDEINQIGSCNTGLPSLPCVQLEYCSGPHI